MLSPRISSVSFGRTLAPRVIAFRDNNSLLDPSDVQCILFSQPSRKTRVTHSLANTHTHMTSYFPAFDKIYTSRTTKNVPMLGHLLSTLFRCPSRGLYSYHLGCVPFVHSKDINGEFVYASIQGNNYAHIYTQWFRNYVCDLR